MYMRGRVEERGGVGGVFISLGRGVNLGVV